MSKIVLYSTGCPNCVVLKRLLDKNEIKYDLHNNIEEIVDKGFRSVPVLKVNDKYLGFADSIKYVKEID